MDVAINLGKKHDIASVRKKKVWKGRDFKFMITYTFLLSQSFFFFLFLSKLVYGNGTLLTFILADLKAMYSWILKAKKMTAGK